MVAFGVTFAGGLWLGIGDTAPVAIPTAVAFAPPAEPGTGRLPLLAKAPPAAELAAPSKGLTQNEGLRRTVILRARAYQRPACKQDAHSRYVAAAAWHAEKLMRATGCSNFPDCAMEEGTLKDVWRLNRSSADLKVARAMAAANRAGGLSARSFRGDVGKAVRVVAGAGFSPGPVPRCVATSNAPSRRWWDAMGGAVARGAARGLLSAMNRRRSSRFRFRLRFGR